MHFFQNLETKPILIDLARNQVSNNNLVENHIVFFAKSWYADCVKHVASHFLPI